MEEDQTIRAAVLKSDLKSIFCAGIDFSEFMKGPESFAAYWRTIRKVFDTIYSSRLNTAASMHGHSLGLGCVLGMACQDRFMIRGAAPGVGSLFGSLGHDGAAAPPPPTSKPPTIGLNEVAVGVPVPEWLVELFGMITSEEMDAFVIRYLEGRNTVPREAQVETMRVIRRRFLEQFRAMEEADVANITRYVQAEEAQAVLRESMAKLASKARRA
ncbi:dodecenoyl-CoA isomerase [Lunasporangiospora selenospora]|uniref:Dodecenoyl-CoA isomerase n=1 Tax=Lunasporangiospora selenospora TaxID=979761 RepID=A0A9P6KJ17_9FUNG|nr:dodecenoyl-CoA isomerase [Lunasporangiospora selenospora]